MESLQGICVPVALGSIDLPRPYNMGMEVKVVHLLLLSWGGRPLRSAPMSEHYVSQERKRSLISLEKLGVTHGTVRKQNSLWCEETVGVMLIDFEKAVVRDVVKKEGGKKRAIPEEWGRWEPQKETKKRAKK